MKVIIILLPSNLNVRIMCVNNYSKDYHYKGRGKDGLYQIFEFYLNCSNKIHHRTFP